LVGDIVGAKGALAEVVRTELTKARYVPATSAGMPIASRTRVDARIVLVPVGGDDYTVKFDDIRLAPDWLAGPPPRYPIGRARTNNSGHVTLELTLGGDGRVRNVVAVEASDPAFAKEALAVAKWWRFEPSGAEDARFEYVVTQPIWFKASRSERPPEFHCRWDQRRPKWEQQVEGGCLDLLTVSISL
jgi:TonB family protein